MCEILSNRTNVWLRFKWVFKEIKKIRSLLYPQQCCSDPPCWAAMICPVYPHDSCSQPEVYGKKLMRPVIGCSNDVGIWAHHYCSQVNKGWIGSTGCNGGIKMVSISCFVIYIIPSRGQFCNRLENPFLL